MKHQRVWSTIFAILILFSFSAIAKTQDVAQPETITEETLWLAEHAGTHINVKLVDYSVYMSETAEGNYRFFVDELENLIFDTGENAVYRGVDLTKKIENNRCILTYKSLEAVEGSKIIFKNMRNKWTIDAQWDENRFLASIPHQKTWNAQIKTRMIKQESLQETETVSVTEETLWPVKHAGTHINVTLVNYSVYMSESGEGNYRFFVDELEDLIFDTGENAVYRGVDLTKKIENNRCILTYKSLEPLEGSKIIFKNMRNKWTIDVQWEDNRFLASIPHQKIMKTKIGTKEVKRESLQKAETKSEQKTEKK